MIIWNSIAATTESEFSYIAHFSSEGALFLLPENQNQGGFAHEEMLRVENPRPRQMTLDYFYGQSGELFSYFRIPKAHLLTYLIGFAPGSMVRA